jgi:OOP family OmpA-OmpF porin
MPGNLVSGTAGFDGTALYLDGVAISDETGSAIGAIAAAVGVDADITARPDATADDAAALEQELNAFVTDNPIRFEQSSAVLTDEGIAVVDQLATLALRFDGVAITVEGHTDTDGDATANLTLSQARADAVRDALVERGLDAAAVTAEGFGEQQPVVVDGVEDKLASRRVEFRIQTTP